MPKVISHTPPWLSRPSPGFGLFSSEKKTLSSEPEVQRIADGFNRTTDLVGPQRIIAQRATEVFVVVGNIIRWTDLSMLKDSWEEHDQSRSRTSRSPSHDNEFPDEDGSDYRTLKVPVNEQIRQLVLSPNKELLAILTSHTAHIAVLPDSSHLGQPDTGPIRVKTYHLGPTTHVLSQSAIVSALWHPLGVDGECIVTITADAVVRMWELDRENRWSFDSPKLGIDMKKLQNATSARDDFSPSKLNTNRGFSLDALGMEVASACFGGFGSRVESGWCSMTLWIGMTEGDVYALCPLLPSRWQSPDSLIPVLTTTVDAKLRHAQADDLASQECQNLEDQYQWLAAIDDQDPIAVDGGFDFLHERVIYKCPSVPGPVPRLQGPFHYFPTQMEDEDLELADIHVVASKIDQGELLGAEEEDADSDETESGGLSASVICLLTRAGRVYVCLDLDGVDAQWLPSRESNQRLRPDPPPQPELVLLEAFETMRLEQISDYEWPTFSPDVYSRHAFFVAHSRGVYFFSLEPWIEKMESELQDDGEGGSKVRLSVLKAGFGTLRERILQIEHPDDVGLTASVAVPIILQDSDLGYFLLTVSSERPYAVIFETPYEEAQDSEGYNLAELDEPDMKMLTLTSARQVYHAPQSFFSESSITNFIRDHVHARHRHMVKEEIRLSNATLDLMTEAHRILNKETHQLGLAVADLFRRCQRLQEELRDQIRCTKGIASQIERIRGEDTEDFGDDKLQGSARIKERMQAAKTRQEYIVARIEAVRKKAVKVGARELSEKEEAWVAEVKKLQMSISGPGSDDQGDGEHNGNDPWQRYQEAQALAQEMVSQARSAATDSGGDNSVNGTFKVPPDIRKLKVAQVMTLLERETALVDAAQFRLEQLSLSAAP